MANYENSRIRCSKATAKCLMTDKSDPYYDPIDFRKALDLEPGAYISYDISYGWDVDIEELSEDQMEFGFMTRWYVNPDLIKELISRYHDLEWWFNLEDIDIYHYYWYEGEVVEDLHHVTEEEEDYLQKLYDEREEVGDESEHYDVIYTEKTDQSVLVNFHPDKDSDEYATYMSFVNKMAKKIVNENLIGELEEYNYEWTAKYRLFGGCLSVRLQCLYKCDDDMSRYKMNTLSEDVLDAVQDMVYPYNYELYHAIFGVAIGDALGVPYEFKQRGTFECKDMIGFGTHYQPEGTWSDDTAMTLATLKSLKENNGKVNIDDMRKKFQLWINDGEFTVDGTVFDYGNATHKALSTGIPCTGEMENGNGSLMRILPLAFVNCTDDEIRAVSAITHAHKISMEACVIYVHVARRLLAGENIDDIIPTLKYEKPFDRLCQINELDSTDIRSSGYVVDTLEAALWAVSHREWNEDHTAYQGCSFDTNLLWAINLGDDTDTVGAVTGGLLGIMYEYFLYGEKWRKQLRNKELILDCLWK